MDESLAYVLTDGFPESAGGFTTPKRRHPGCSGIKASFSMSSLRDNLSPIRDMPGVVMTPATLPRHKKQDGLRRARSCSNKDEFWAALQSDYNYLMNDELIETCKEANGELSCDDEEMCAEFYSHYNELRFQIENLESQMPKQGMELCFTDCLKSLHTKVTLFNEHSQRLLRHYPEMTDEIHARVDSLNALWDDVQQCVTPSENQDETTALKREIRLLRKWVRDVEDQLGPLNLRADWDSTESESRLTRHRGLQKEIETRFKNVLTVVNSAKRFRDLDPHSRESDCVYRTALNLQHRFKTLWLRSLEWLCWLENLLRGGNRTSGARGGEESDSDEQGDEPRVKYPRLGASEVTIQQQQRSHQGNASAGSSVSAKELEPEQQQLQESQHLPRTSHHKKPLDRRGAATGGAMVGGDRRQANAAMECPDVGYSSDSSAHRSNEELVNECVRVYTYTSAEAKLPRVLEVVMDCNRTPRKTPPPSPPPRNPSVDGMPVADSPGPNCGLFIFCHEDSDMDHQQVESESSGQVPVSPSGSRACRQATSRTNDRERLSSDDLMDGENDGMMVDDYDDDRISDLTFSALSDFASDTLLTDAGHEPPPQNGIIHKLVDQAEQMVCPARTLHSSRLGYSRYGVAAGSRNGTAGSSTGNSCRGSTPVTPVMDSSCDASGEYTTSSGSDSDGDSTSSAKEGIGSVIHLKASSLEFQGSGGGRYPGGDEGLVGAPGVGGVSGSGGPELSAAVKMRTKKRRNTDRPSSFVEVRRSGPAFNLSSSYSETALNRMPTNSERWPAAGPSSGGSGDSASKSSRRARRALGRRRTSAASRSGDLREGVVKCQSLVSLRRASSSDTGGWKTELSGPESMDRGSLPEQSGERPISDSETGSGKPSLDLGSKITSSVASLEDGMWEDNLKTLYYYPSDSYSEQSADPEEVHRLMNFGDDYGMFMSDGASTPNFSFHPKGGTAGRGGVRAARRIFGKKSPANESGQSVVLDSESDIEDVQDFFNRSQRQLLRMERELVEVKYEDPSEPGQHPCMREFLATCHEHILCLEELWNQLTVAQLPPTDIVGLNVQEAGDGFRHRWQKLLMEAESHQSNLDQLDELRKEVEAFRKTLADRRKDVEGVTEQVCDEESLRDMKNAMLEESKFIADHKKKLEDLNFRINAFVAHSGLQVDYLKRDVLGLYQLWEEARDKIEHTETWLEKAQAAWSNLEQQLNLLQAVQTEEDAVLEKMAVALEKTPEEFRRALPPGMSFLEVRHVSELRKMLEGNEYDEQMTDEGFQKLEGLKTASRTLLEVLGDGPASTHVMQLERTAVEKAEEQRRGCQQLALKMMSLLEQKENVAQAHDTRTLEKTRTVQNSGIPANELLSSASPGRVRRLRKSRLKAMSSLDKDHASATPPSPPLLWRVLRAAVPIQLMVVVLFCFACLMEPHCCDSVNNMNFSLAPQLRYVRGPPPV